MSAKDRIFDEQVKNLLESLLKLPSCFLPAPSVWLSVPVEQFESCLDDMRRALSRFDYSERVSPTRPENFFFVRPDGERLISITVLRESTGEPEQEASE